MLRKEKVFCFEIRNYVYNILQLTESWYSLFLQVRPYKWPREINSLRDAASSSLKSSGADGVGVSVPGCTEKSMAGQSMLPLGLQSHRDIYKICMEHFCCSTFTGILTSPSHETTSVIQHHFSSTIIVPINTRSASEPVLLNIHTCFVP